MAKKSKHPLVPLIAVFFGLLFSPMSRQYPILHWLFNLWPPLIGLLPSLTPQPWGYTFEQLSKVDLKGQFALVTGMLTVIDCVSFCWYHIVSCTLMNTYLARRQQWHRIRNSICPLQTRSIRNNCLSKSTAMLCRGGQNTERNIRSANLTINYGCIGSLICAKSSKDLANAQ